GPYADAHGAVGPAGVGARGYANLSAAGIRAGAGAGVGIDQAVGIQGQATAGLGRYNEVHADITGNVGQSTVDAGAGIYPQFRPDAYVRTSQRMVAQQTRGIVPVSAPGVEVRPVPPPAEIEVRPLPPIETDPRGSDGLTMSERAAKYHADRHQKA